MKPMRMDHDATHTIGTLRETSLHAALKAWYAQPGDEMEASVEGYQIDLRRGAQLIEIQTRNFAALKRKLTQLVERHPVRLVGPLWAGAVFDLNANYPYVSGAVILFIVFLLSLLWMGAGKMNAAPAVSK
ncbi:MAG: hypothetical protein HW418_3355 [Anaerolineales bacterium]|nr:hypothetical protein [Anaerolineales bacterium]